MTPPRRGRLELSLRLLQALALAVLALLVLAAPTHAASATCDDGTRADRASAARRAPRGAAEHLQSVSAPAEVASFAAECNLEESLAAPELACEDTSWQGPRPRSCQVIRWADTQLVASRLDQRARRSRGPPA